MAKFIPPSYEIITPKTEEEGIALLKHVEHLSRISHRSEDQMTEDTWKRLIKAILVDKGDWSVAEHSIACVIMRLSRSIANELVRHRIASYTQESTRFVNYGKKDKVTGRVPDMEFILPLEFTKQPGETWAQNQVDALLDYEEGCKTEEARYHRQLARGVKPQVAREGLPLGLASTIAITMNLRSWRHIFMMRSTKETHEDFRRVLDQVLVDFKARIPIIYDDIEAGLKQSVSLSKPR
jgi:thymidylate synthase (FAD)